MPTNVIGSKISSKYFMWHADTKTFSIDMSEASHVGRPLGQLYNDACDEGFVMVSDKTGKEVEFALQNQFFDADGDTTCWVLAPTLLAKYRNPRLEGVSVKIWNT